MAIEDKVWDDLRNANIEGDFLKFCKLADFIRLNGSKSDVNRLKFVYN